MKKLLPVLLILSFLSPAFSQEKPIPIEGSYTIPEIGGEIRIELKSAALDSPYSRNEYFEIFGPDKLPIDAPNGSVQVLCAFDECNKLIYDEDYGEEGIRYPAGSLRGAGLQPRTPLSLKVNRLIDPGTYTILVIHPATRKVLHRRELLLVQPEPVVTGYTVIYPARDSTSNKIIIDQNKDLLGVKIKLQGENLDQDFKSVTFAGLRLEKVEGENNTYRTTQDWTSSKLKKIDFENAKLSFERDFVSERDEVAVRIIGGAPKINGNLVYKINAGQGRFLLTLNVSNLHPRAQLKVEEINGQHVLDLKGTFDGANIDLDNETLSQKIQLREEALSTGSASFSVQVINRDGSKSQVRKVQLQLIAATVTAEPLDEGRPLIQNLPVMVRFKRAGNAKTFLFEGPVTIRMNGQTERTLEPQNIDGTLDQFTAEVIFPEGTASSVPFEIRNKENVWRGFFTDIRERPELVNTTRTVFIGSTATFQLTRPHEDIRAIIRPPVKGVKLQDNDFTDGQVDIMADKTVPANTTFSIVLFLDDHELEIIDYSVVGWPDPKKTVSFVVGNQIKEISENGKMIFNPKEAVIIQSNADVTSVSQLSAQLIKANGTKLGTAQSLIFDEAQKISKTTLNPYAYGLRGGDEFMVELVNPLSQPILQRGYIKREGLQRILVNAGVSAVNVFLKKRRDQNGDRLPSTTLISGVNLGIYYMSERFYASGKRPLGYGINLIAQEEDKEVKVRLAGSILIYETLTTGLSFGQDGPAFFIGANVSFLDLSKIFSGGN